MAMQGDYRAGWPGDEDDEDEDDEDLVEWRPTSRGGAVLDFYCCDEPKVVWEEKTKWDAEKAICDNCDHDWTDRMDQ